MCGIAGIIQKERVNDLLIKSMAQTLIHRGPDHTGYYFDDNAGFLHNRLSLLDLSENGNQPFVDDDFVLLYNGEIYNHQELRKKHLSQFNFVSSSDTETLFLLLKHLGIEHTCSEIEGMFAFSFYNKKTKELFLVRDRIGIKPLFYYHYNNRIVFSSELKGISSHFPLNINKLKILSAALGEFEYSRTHTSFENVYQLTPGSILKYDLFENKLTLNSYFELTDYVDENEYNRLSLKTNGELLEEFESLFRNSVEKMMLSDVQVGAFVSGGIDSSIIATFASENAAIELFTANVEGKYSELPFAKMLSEEIKMPLNIYNHYPQDLIHKLVETTWHYEAPIVVHPNSIPFQGVAEMAKNKGIKPVLTGEGSDELFLGYPRLLTKKWDKLIKLPFNITENIYKKIPGLQRYLNLNKTNYNRDLLELPFNLEKQNNQKRYAESYKFVSDKRLRTEHILSIEMLGRGLHSLLWRNDRMGMMHSLEARFPFLDDKIIKFALNLPINMKIGRTNKFYNYKHPFLIDKYIVRKLAEKKLPNALTHRKKDGFPLYGFLHAEIKDDFFKNGFLQNLMEWNEEGRISFELKTEKYLKAKLACVEIWGRLLVNKEDKSSLQEHVNKHLKIKVN